MQTLFAIWLVLTIFTSLFVCWRWSSNGLLNASFKFAFFFVAVGGIVFAYHHYVAGNVL